MSGPYDMRSGWEAARRELQPGFDAAHFEQQQRLLAEARDAEVQRVVAQASLPYFEVVSAIVDQFLETIRPYLKEVIVDRRFNVGGIDIECYRARGFALHCNFKDSAWPLHSGGCIHHVFTVVPDGSWRFSCGYDSYEITSRPPTLFARERRNALLTPDLVLAQLCPPMAQRCLTAFLIGFGIPLPG